MPLHRDGLRASAGAWACSARRLTGEKHVQRNWEKLEALAAGRDTPAVGAGRHADPAGLPNLRDEVYEQDAMSTARQSIDVGKNS